MNNKPVAWGMLDKDGGIYDSISPEEHDREEGAYTIPLYTHPAKTLTITDDEVMNLWNEVSSHPADFARAILRKAQEK
jgi:hypothetical protein